MRLHLLTIMRTKSSRIWMVIDSKSHLFILEMAMIKEATTTRRKRRKSEMDHLHSMATMNLTSHDVHTACPCKKSTQIDSINGNATTMICWANAPSWKQSINGVKMSTWLAAVEAWAINFLMHFCQPVASTNFVIYAWVLRLPWFCLHTSVWLNLIFHTGHFGNILWFPIFVGNRCNLCIESWMPVDRSSCAYDFARLNIRTATNRSQGMRQKSMLVASHEKFSCWILSMWTKRLRLILFFQIFSLNWWIDVRWNSEFNIDVSTFI